LLDASWVARGAAVISGPQLMPVASALPLSWLELAVSRGKDVIVADGVLRVLVTTWLEALPVNSVVIDCPMLEIVLMCWLDDGVATLLVEVVVANMLSITLLASEAIAKSQRTRDDGLHNGGVALQGGMLC